MIDLHSHLDLYREPIKVLDKANCHNLFTLAVTTSPKAWVATSEVFRGYERVKVALGLHPEIACQKRAELELLLCLIAKSKYVGEIGIDGSSRFQKTIDLQERIFDLALRECHRNSGRVISIHSRGAVPKVLTKLKKYSDIGIPILHWFVGSNSDLIDAIKQRCYFSINLAMLRSRKGVDIVSKIPKEFILPESDGPFAMNNGKPIFPWQAMDVCSYLSEIWCMPIGETKAQVFRNFNDLMSESRLLEEA